MEIFKEKNNSLESINQVPFKLEKDIQEIVEGNTQTLFNLEFIASEVSVGNYRIDSAIPNRTPCIGITKRVC